MQAIEAQGCPRHVMGIDMLKTVLASSFLTLALMTSASAACQIPGNYRFYVDQNDTVTYSPLTDAKGCGHNYTAGGSVTFTSASIVNQPRNGTLRQQGPLRFGYLPKPGFKGQDSYTIKVCGNNRGGSGCSTLHYNATVQ